MLLDQIALAHNLQKALHNSDAYLDSCAIVTYVSKPAVKGFVHADVKNPNSVSGLLAISSHTPSTFSPLLNCPHSAIDRKMVWCRKTILDISSLSDKEALASGFV